MKTLMRMCIPAVLGAAALFGATPAAMAVGPLETKPVLTALADERVDGPFYTYKDAVADAVYRQSQGFQTAIEYDEDGDFYYVIRY